VLRKRFRDGGDETVVELVELQPLHENPVLIKVIRDRSVELLRE
jgi:hypothetical protein